MSSDADAINKTAQEYTDALNAGDLDKWAGTFTEDVVFLPREHPLVSGKEAVRAWAKETLFDPFKMHLQFGFDELEVLGVWAFAYGRFTLAVTPAGGGSQTERRGKFINLFRREPDGSWKYARAIWNFDAPAPSGQ